LDNKIYEDCLSHWLSSAGNQPFWADLAKKHKFPSVEMLRSQFRRERKKRGTFKVNNQKIQVTPNKPLVAVFDIETLPMRVETFSLWDQNIGVEQVIDSGMMLSWAGKYLGDGTIYSDIVSPSEAVNRDTKRISISIYEFLKNASAGIGHNLRSFDAKIINTEFLKNDIPLLRYRIIDTLEIAKSNLRFDSNKMGYINRVLGIREKISNDGFPLWRRCGLGDEEALDTMADYNAGDVIATEELFLKLRPFIGNTLNFSTYNLDSDELACHCGSINVKLENSFWFTNTGKYSKYRCGDCGSLLRGKKNLLPKEKRDSLLVKL
jgi:DNA polymerase elongation subunit (family B)